MYIAQYTLRKLNLHGLSCWSDRVTEIINYESTVVTWVAAYQGCEYIDAALGHVLISDWMLAWSINNQLWELRNRRLTERFLKFCALLMTSARDLNQSISLYHTATWRSCPIAFRRREVAALFGDDVCGCSDCSDGGCWSLRGSPATAFPVPKLVLDSSP